MLTVFVAIYALSPPVESCNKATAAGWAVAPQPQAPPGDCLIHGQQFAVKSRLIVEGTCGKIFGRGAGGKRTVAVR